MDQKALLLLIVGLITQAAGYVLDKADFFGFVVPLVSPTYVSGNEAARVIRSGQSVTPGARGFDAAEYFFKLEASKQNPSELLAFIRVTEFKPGDASLAFSVGGAIPQLPLRVALSNGQTVEWETGALERALADYKASRLTLASIFVFCVGILLQIIGFVVERQNERKELAPSNKPLQPTSGEAPVG